MKQFEFERVWNAKVFPRRLALPLHCCLSLTGCQTRRRRRRRLSSSGPNVDIINSCRKLIKCKLSNHIIISYGSHKSNTHTHSHTDVPREIMCVATYGKRAVCLWNGSKTKAWRSFSQCGLLDKLCSNYASNHQNIYAKLLSILIWVQRVPFHTFHSSRKPRQFGRESESKSWWRARLVFLWRLPWIWPGSAGVAAAVAAAAAAVVVPLRLIN